MAFLSTFARVHCVGIGGIGISGVARFCKLQGKEVSGSDIVASALTDALIREGVSVHTGPSQASWLPADCDLLVYSEAVSADAPERKEAERLGIRQLGHFGFIGELSREYRTICISGTNGKSTTTAMVGKIFEAAGMDPTVFVGSLLPDWEFGNVRVGKSDILIVEGDEYKKKMLALHPEVTLITNIEADHLDVYKDLQDIEESFHKLCEQTTRLVFLNPHDGDRGIVCGHEQAEARFFGEALQNGQRKTYAGSQMLEMKARIFPFLPFQKTAGTLTLQIPGAFNMMNALGAVALGEAFDIDFAVMQKVLADFTGIWRRFERVGEFAGAQVISDYAHHPTAIKGTLKAAKEFFPGKRIVALFEPHQHSRTKELFDDFVISFDDADVLILSEVYGVAGRTEEKDRVSSEDLLVAVEKHQEGRGVKSDRYFAHDLTEAEEKIREVVREGDVILVMGAGNVDKVARNLVS